MMQNRLSLKKILFGTTPVAAVFLLIMLHTLGRGTPLGSEPSMTEQTEMILSMTAVRDVSIFSGAPLNAEDFFAEGRPDGVKISFETIPPTDRAGRYPVVLILSLDGQSQKREAVLTVSECLSLLRLPIGSDRVISVADFVGNNATDAEFVDFYPNSFSRSEPGLYRGKIRIDGQLYEIALEIADLTPPTGDPVTGVTVFLNQTVDPSLLVTNLSDYGKITVGYAEEPDFSREGEIPVSVLLTDDSGNRATVDTVVTVIRDTEPPVFSGISDKTITVGDGISYKKGVTVTDNSGEVPDFTVDSSAVNRNKPGVYSVVYTATDSSGNTARETMTVTVVRVSTEQVNRKLEQIAARIISDGMTRDEKILAVWKYTRKAITYTGRSDKTDLYSAAYEGLVTGGGDCYTYYALNALLFDFLGIENVEVRRVDGQSRHWWSLVLFEDGLWYFVDSCPLPAKMGQHAGMTGRMTKSDLAYLTSLSDQIAGEEGVYSGYYEYDTALDALYAVAP